MSIVDVEGGSVDVLGALIRNSSANLIVAPSVDIIDRWIALRLTLRDHSRRQRNQVHHVSAIQRHLLYRSSFNHLTERGRV